jgi:hypothetical protein
MLRKMPWTASFFVNLESQSAVESWPSGSPSSRRASAIPLSSFAVPGEPRQQEAPASAGDIDVLAADPVQHRRIRHPDVEGGADRGEGLLRDAAGLDDNGTVVDLETVDVAGRGPAADVAEPLGDQDPVAAVSQPGRGQQPPGPGPDDDHVECVIHGSAGRVPAGQGAVHVHGPPERHG